MNAFEKMLDVIFPPDTLELFGRSLNTEALASWPNSETLPFSWIESLFNYKHEGVRDAIELLKYRGHSHTTSILGLFVYEHLLDEASEQMLFGEFQQSVLVPIPLSRKRRQERGYNQSELLVRAVEKEDENGLCSYDYRSLRRVKHTRSQTQARNKRERMENLAEAFSVKNPESIRGKEMILIDDVTTTGSTLASARKTLLKAGAKKVTALTIAH